MGGGERCAKLTGGQTLGRSHLFSSRLAQSKTSITWIRHDTNALGTLLARPGLGCCRYGGPAAGPLAKDLAVSVDRFSDAGADSAAFGRRVGSASQVRRVAGR